MVWEFIKYIGIFAVTSGILAWLMKQLFLISINKDLEKFKSELTLKVEEYKFNMQLVGIEHQVRFSKLHTDRAEVIKKLYEKIVTLESALCSTTKLFQPAGEPDLKEKLDKVVKSHNDFINYYDPNKIYFEPEICSLIETLRNSSQDTFYRITTYPVDRHDPEYKNNPTLLDERKGQWDKARVTVQEDIVKIKNQLEDEFRKLLGTVN